jgi:hypothetical protein
MRFLYTLGVCYVALCGALLWRGREVAPPPAPARPPHQAPVEAAGTGAEWFQRIKPFCNSVEVETQLRFQPPPAGMEGSGFAAACLALAGKITQARERIVALPESERATAVGIVFEIGHPVADAGDDKSAGPIMELVVEFWPNHYMALYHAGAARFDLGDYAIAQKYLESFMVEYGTEDGWRSSARGMLERIAEQGVTEPQSPAQGLGDPI